MKPSIYVETTILSYLGARRSHDVVVLAHQQITLDWWDRRRNSFDLYISQFVIDELSAGDAEASQRRLAYAQSIPLLAVDTRSLDLAERLTNALGLPQKSRVDAAHIAVAAVNSMNYLMTWNCRHLANAQLSSRVNEACCDFGVSPPIICTPEQLLEDDSHA